MTARDKRNWDRHFARINRETQQRWRVVTDTDTSGRQRVEPIGQLQLPIA